MRALLITAAVVVLATPSLAQERGRRSTEPMPMPSIMVEEDAPELRQTRRGRRATSAQRARPDARQASRRPPARRALVGSTLPSRSEDATRTINRSIEAQQQQLRIEQQSQFETNQLRQSLQRDQLGSGLRASGCSISAIGC